MGMVQTAAEVYTPGTWYPVIFLVNLSLDTNNQHAADAENRLRVILPEGTAGSAYCPLFSGGKHLFRLSQFTTPWISLVL